MICYHIIYLSKFISDNIGYLNFLCLFVLFLYLDKNTFLSAVQIPKQCQNENVKEKVREDENIIEHKEG